jgi:hypothetical protein
MKRPPPSLALRWPTRGRTRLSAHNAPRLSTNTRSPTNMTHLNAPLHRPPHSKEAKLLKTMKFPPSFATPLDLARVNWEAVRPWVTERVTAILGGVEDDVLIEYLMEQLQGKEV